MNKLKFGDIIFTTPKIYEKNLHGLMSYVISRVTRGGPTHVMMSIGNNNMVLHLDYPRMKRESLSEALQSRPGCDIVVKRPRYSFVQKLKLRWVVWKIQRKEIKYSMFELVKILWVLKTSKQYNIRAMNRVCSTFLVNILRNVGMNINCLTPKSLLEIL